MVFEDLLVIALCTGSVTLAANILGAAVYDIKRINEQADLAAHPYSRAVRERPLVSVVVTTHNSERSIERCLESLLKSSYRKIEVVVIDNGSTDQTKQIVKSFITSHPKKSIKLETRGSSRPTFTKSSLSRKSVSGELVAVINSSFILDKQAISRAVSHFNAHPASEILGFNVKVSSSYSTLGLFQQFAQLMHYRANKSASLLNSAAILPNEGTVYRWSALKRIIGSQFSAPDGLTSYASDIVAYHEEAPSALAFVRANYVLQLNRLQALWRPPVAFKVRKAKQLSRGLLRLVVALCSTLSGLLVPLLASYFIYLAIALHEPALFIVSCLGFSLFLGFVVWGDDQLALGQKTTYSLLIPITYGLFYLLSFMQYVVALTGAFKGLKYLASKFKPLELSLSAGS